MSSIVNYEVYMYESATWALLARYPADKRVDAVDYAKSMEFSRSKPTKVVRETYNLETKEFQESLVYLSEYSKVSQTKPKKQPYAFPSLKDERNGGGGMFRFGFILKLLSIIALALVVAAFIAVIFLKAMSSVGFAANQISSSVIFALFVLFFLLLSIPMSLKWIEWDQITTYDDSDASSDFHLNDGSKSDASPALEHRAFAKTLVRWLFSIFDPIKTSKILKEAENIINEEEQNPAVQDINEIKNQEVSSFTPPEATKSSDASSTSIPMASPPQPEESPVEIQKEYTQVTSLLSHLLKVLNQNKIDLDTVARFGIALLIAGAIEYQSKRNNLSEENHKKLSFALFKVMGISYILSEEFFKKIPEYMLEPNYLSVFQGGSLAMGQFLDGINTPTEAMATLRSVLLKWISPNTQEMSQSGVVTVMFTDMVGSTILTQNLGDKMAQQMIRTHNTIVRQALSTCNGREIKLTGDGIMASFVSAAGAVDACMLIQKSIQLYNNDNPTVPLEVRIGLNTGEPIVEENDLYGTMVQIASRICNLAPKDKIYISALVKDLVAGKPYPFVDLGEYLLKGITTPVHLYEVNWLDGVSDQGITDEPIPLEKVLQKL